MFGIYLRIHRSMSKALRWFLVSLVTVFVLAAGYVGLAFATQNALPSEITINGIDISGLSEDEARDRLNEEFKKRGKQSITVIPQQDGTTADDVNVEFTPSESGLSADVDSTLEGLTGLTFNPAELSHRIFGKADISVNQKVDQEKFDATMKGVEKQLTTDPTEGTAAYKGAELTFNKPVDGFKVETDELSQQLRGDWADSIETVQAPGKTVAPEISEEQWNEFVETTAQLLVDAPIKVTAGDISAELTAEQLGEAARIETEGKDEDQKPALKLDSEKLVEYLTKNNQDFRSDVKDASVRLKGSGGKGRPEIVPSKSGQGVDDEELAQRIIEDIQGEATRSVSVELTEQQPDITTEDAKKWDVTHATESFGTPYPTWDTTRTKNLKAGIAKVNGTVVMPGEEFNLNSLLAPITAENGYYSSGVVESGISTTAMGGGLSQIATMSYNAGFLAGMDIVEFKPHSRWFDRYPKGRESTYWEGQINVRWKNNTDAPVIVEMWLTGDEVKTRTWGSNYYTVTTKTSEPYAFTESPTLSSTDPNCIPERGGRQGFSVDVERTRTPRGGSAEKESWTWAYTGWPTVTCE